MKAPEPEPEPVVLPAIKTMKVGDGTLAGDMNFDPLQISDTPAALAWYREAEIKHARLAMLAAFGWPVSEITNFGNLLNADGRAPSLLNGGLENINVVYWAAVIGLGVFAESKGLDKQYGKQQDYLPGMIGFDPLGADSPSMRNAEITNGRVAMVAITIYALEEAVTKAPIFPINLVSQFRGTVAAVSDAVGDVAAAVGAAVDTPALDSLLSAADTAADAVGDAAADVAAAGAAVAAAADAAADAVGDAAAASAPVAMLGVAGQEAVAPPPPPVEEAPAPPPLPKIKTMRVGDGTLAGDMNFDPLGISNSPESLAWYREAEIRHARLAMLAAFGWPVSELTNFGSLLTPDG